jgi:MinD-like ATPase involved in chromosome partitioning or flagellar assembly
MTGTVVTFYSYKGGVGRSFALANTAVLLAKWGHRVLCLDWDLEAPGLHDYFRPLFDEQPSAGVLDLIDDFLTDRRRTLRDLITHTTADGKLDVMAAGDQDSDYPARVQELDWDRLYRRGFADYLETRRAEWVADYDFVLLDSRTGLSDIGGICTAHLPDRLVVLFTANEQSVRGAVDVARRADIARDRMPYDRPQLPILPVLSRFDGREEYLRAEEWRRACLMETKGLFDNWLHQAVPVDAMARHATIPYVSYWSFGEQLPVRTEVDPSPDQVSFALETLAAVIAHGFDRTDLLAEERDAFVAAARVAQRDFTLDVRVSTPRSALNIATDLVRDLRSRGQRAELSLSGDRSLLTRAHDDARHLCLVVDGEISRWQSAEVELFLRRTLGQDRRLIPVLTKNPRHKAIPGYVENLRSLLLDHSGTAVLADRLIAEIYKSSH